ncbi:MAG TPA: CBS domain-containing protein [Gammaproteobacteria bacterium]|nr:CBS domain-containing protein [Gammaproteobacteria bacterium]
MRIEKIMTTPIVSVEMDDTLEKVKEIFDNARFHHILVVESDLLVGVISDKDYYKAISPNINTLAETTHDAASLNKKVHQIMSRKPVTLSSDNDAYDAIDVFKKNDISCIPVVDKARRPVGIISWRDTLKIIA